MYDDSLSSRSFIRGLLYCSVTRKETISRNPNDKKTRGFMAVSYKASTPSMAAQSDKPIGARELSGPDGSKPRFEYTGEQGNIKYIVREGTSRRPIAALSASA